MLLCADILLSCPLLGNGRFTSLTAEMAQGLGCLQDATLNLHWLHQHALSLLDFELALMS